MHLVDFLKSRIKTLPRQEEGTAFIEFTIVVPVMLVLFFGCVELTRFALIVQKLEKTASTIANIVTQNSPATGSIPATLNDQAMGQLLSSVQYMMYPYTTYSTINGGSALINTRVIVTDIENTNTTTTAPTPTVMWQFCSSYAGGGIRYTSKLTSGCPYNSVNGVSTPAGCNGTQINFTGANFSAAFVGAMQPSEELVVSEVYFNFQPITNSKLVSALTLYRTSAQMPRLGTLAAYSPDNTSPEPSSGPTPPSTCP